MSLPLSKPVLRDEDAFAEKKEYKVNQEELLKIIRRAEKEQVSELDLSGRNLTQLPPDIGRLTHLTKLYLSANQLRELPREIAKLKNLMVLNLNSNQLARLPAEIFQLTKLLELNLGTNHLIKLPREIGQLRDLTSLYLDSNQLQILPKEIGKLDHLNILNLSFNQLRTLPSEISNLRNLTLFYLDSNRLRKLPREIVRLKKLIHLDLNKNPLAFPPLEIAGQGIPAIRDYLGKSGREGQILYEGKVLVVGQGGVGKTCLIRRLIRGDFPKGQATTRGINIQPWQLVAADEDSTRMTLNVWDFGGQEIYHATHQFFLTQRSLYILVWDACQEEEQTRIEYWLNAIETFAEDSPVLIVMNKADERDNALNFKELKKRYPQIVASVKVSAKKGTGITALRKRIADQAWKLPIMGTFWPSAWLAVRKALEATPISYLPYKQYLHVCEKLSIEAREGKTLSHYLHDLGIVLHFQKDILLRNIIILKPEWGTDAVYKVLDSRLVQASKGLLYNKDLPRIWTDQRLYPRTRYSTIMRLMAYFELVFPFGEAGCNIVVSFLSPKEAEYKWTPRNPLCFEYHYEFLPAGVMTRLIVRMHEFLIQRGGHPLCWRDGAYFRSKESQALVRINPHTRIAAIQIDGSGKRDFLTIFRTHFNAIHKTIKKIRFQEKIPCICTPGCPHRFDHHFLIKCEEKGIREVICEETADYISVEKLLEITDTLGVHQKKTPAEEGKKYQKFHMGKNGQDVPASEKNSGMRRIRRALLTLSLLATILGAISFWMGWMPPEVEAFFKTQLSKTISVLSHLTDVGK